ncbi:MAG: hypothetical protein GY906_39475 [bacterium]|nr:hypothetical protein [bacterium]
MKLHCTGVALLIVLLVATAVGAGKLLYEESVGITLDDGTIVYLIMDDYGVKQAKPPGADSRMQRAKFDYLNRLAKAKMRPQPVTKHAAPPASAMSPAQRARNDERLRARGDLPDRLAAMRDHSKGKFLWPINAGQEKHYYYLPPPPRVAVDKDSRPQFLLMKFTSDRTAKEGGVTGGILHFLCEYGLTPQQEAELKQKLSKEIKGAKLMGPVQMQEGEGESTFRIISATMSEGGFAQRVIASGKAPLLPGQKVAVAARLDATGAVLIEESLKRPTSDISVEFSLAYTSYMPAFDGEITFDWELFKTHVDDWTMDYDKEKKCRVVGILPILFFPIPLRQCNTTYTTNEVRELYDLMCEKEAITIEWTEGIVDERLEAIRQVFFRFMETSFFDRTANLPEMDEDDEDLDEGMTTAEVKGSHTRYHRVVAKSESAFVNKTFQMNVTLPIKTPYVTAGNISGAWYRGAKRDFPELFAEVNIDDPFFQQRLVAFTLDLDAIEIFDQAINFVTVEVRKQRQPSRDFQTSFTLTKEALAEGGPTHMVTYAKMRDDSPEVFDYLVRWSLRGGIEWPANPKWQKGEWEGITLIPPVVPLEVEAEADLQELEDLGFTRATVEIQYTQFGKPITDTRSIQLSVTKSTAIDSLFIFRDRDVSDWKYRVNFYHKRLGRQRARRWLTGGEDGYVFCNIPDDLRERATEAVESEG